MTAVLRNVLSSIPRKFPGMQAMAAMLCALIIAAMSPCVRAGEAGRGRPHDGPANSRILYVDRSKRVWVMDPDGAKPTRLTDFSVGSRFGCSGARWSPDGRQIVFQSQVMGSGVYTMNADGSGLSLVTRLGARYPTGADWATGPDGNDWIVFADVGPDDWTDSVYVVRPDGTGRQRLTRGRGHYWPRWSPGGDRLAAIVFERGLRELVLLDLQFAEDGAVSVIGQTSLVQDVLGSALACEALGPPAWSPHGLIALGVRGAVGWDIWIVDPLHPELPINLADAPEQWNRDPAWSPDGRRIAFTTQGPDALQPRITVIDFIDASITVLTSGCSRRLPQWRPMPRQPLARDAEGQWAALFQEADPDVDILGRP